MQHQYMRRAGLFLLCWLVLASLRASADVYTLTDGTKIIGDPISENDNGVVFSADSGTDMPRLPWDRLTQDSLQALMDKATSPQQKAFIEPFLDEPPPPKTGMKDITVHPVDYPSRPTTHLGLAAIFASPVGLMVLFILYCTNLFAAYEVALYRSQPIATVCGLAAIPFLGVFSPIIFIAMPTRRMIESDLAGYAEPVTRFQATAPPQDIPVAPPPPDPSPIPQAPAPLVAAPVAAPHPAGPWGHELAPKLPEPVVFQRGEFSFNRRFFETKLAGFFRLVPSEAEKDMVVQIKSGRGDFTGRRITRITPNELYLQVFHDNATADEMIPFTEVMEVQIRHKDLA
jgi:hypothetical protein